MREVSDASATLSLYHPYCSVGAYGDVYEQFQFQVALPEKWKCFFFLHLLAIQMRKVLQIFDFLVAELFPSQKVKNTKVFRARSARK